MHDITGNYVFTFQLIVQMLSKICMACKGPAHAGALQLSGFPQSWELPLSLTKLVMQPAAPYRQYGDPIPQQQYVDFSACVRHLGRLCHLAVYCVDLRLQSLDLFTAASGLPHLRSLHLVHMCASMHASDNICNVAVHVCASLA